MVGPSCSFSLAGLWGCCVWSRGAQDAVGIVVLRSLVIRLLRTLDLSIARLMDVSVVIWV